jgi:single-stranded-DNA-specific exonuclease
MGQKFKKWYARQTQSPQSMTDLIEILKKNRDFTPIDQLNYGDYGLLDAAATIGRAIQEGRRIALYADYDVDGTMSCVSWIWFFEAIGFKNYTHYIPCRFEEGYGLNLRAVQHLIDYEQAQVIITMDTGITANAEAAYCKERGVAFICTDHHKIQPQKMPDCIILNPKMNPDPQYQELCGCGITFVLLRKLGLQFSVSQQVWNDILALVGMATICDVVPLNGVNHKLANMGVRSLLRSQRKVFQRLRQACALEEGLDEKDVGFRIGPRINAVGRLKHAREVVNAFLHNEPEALVAFMGVCNEERKQIQSRIFKEATKSAQSYPQSPILFLGSENWHVGVIGIAASKIAEKYWRPTWLFERQGEMCKGSARSIPGFDVTDAMASAAGFFEKFGGHQAAGGFTFRADRENEIRNALARFALDKLEKQPEVWVSQISYDCTLSNKFLSLELVDWLDQMKPFGNSFEEPLFAIHGSIQSVRFLKDKLSGEAKHTQVFVESDLGQAHKIMFFNEVYEELQSLETASFLVHATKNTFRGQTSLALMGKDWDSRPV